MSSNVELLAHRRLERRQGQVAMGLANAVHGFEPAFIDGGVRHASVEEPADDGFAQAARRNARPELGNPLRRGS
jgi:hypothetical protein